MCWWLVLKRLQYTVSAFTTVWQYDIYYGCGGPVMIKFDKMGAKQQFNGPEMNQFY